MTPFLALLRKDFQIFFNDRRAVIMAFVAPILIGSFFGYVFGGGPNSEDRGKTAVLLVDQENSSLSRDIAARLQRERPLDVQPAQLDEARAAVKKGKAAVAVVIPPGFGKSAADALLHAGPKPTLTVLTDPSHRIEAAMVEGMLTGSVMQAMGGGRNLSIPFTTSEEQITSSAGVLYNPYAHSFGGMAIQFILFMGVDVGIGLLLQRQRGLWKRFRAAPLSKLELLGSRAVSAMLIALMILTVVFTVARIAFGVRIGSVIGFVAVCAAFGLMTATYGLLIAALAKTAEAARGLSILATLFMVMLSGAWVPSFLFPSWMQNVTKLVPARWAMDGLDAMSWRGLPASEAAMPVAVLLGFSLVFGAIAVARFRWEE
jgi:ABC-2 type transport system permease protein